MLSLAVIPGVALLAIVTVAMKAKRRYDLAAAATKAAAVMRRTEILHADQQNDQALIDAIKQGVQTPAQAFASYCQARAALLPAAKLAAPASWDDGDLDRHLARDTYARCSEVGKGLFYRAVCLTLAIVAVAASATGLQYHHLSTAHAVAVDPVTGDGLDGLPDDPFKEFSEIPPVPTK